jgi:hypothetical protein
LSPAAARVADGLVDLVRERAASCGPLRTVDGALLVGERHRRELDAAEANGRRLAPLERRAEQASIESAERVRDPLVGLLLLLHRKRREGPRDRSNEYGAAHEHARAPLLAVAGDRLEVVGGRRQGLVGFGAVRFHARPTLEAARTRVNAPRRDERFTVA